MAQLTTLCSLFLIISSGFLAHRANLFSSIVAKEFNKFIYYFAVPALTFISLADSEKGQFRNYLEFIWLNGLAIMLGYVFLLIFLKIFKFEYTKGGAVLYSSLTGSNIYFAFPIIISLFNKEYLDYAIIYIVFVITISDLIGFILLGLYKNKRDLRNIKSTLSEIFKNPIIWASLLGVFLLIIDIQVPEFIRKSFEAISNSTTGLALFSLGIYISSNFNFRAIRFKEVTISSIYKLMVLPLIVLIIFTLFSDSGEVSAKVSILQAAMPSAAFTVVVADMFSLDKEITAQNILFTSLLFLLSSVFWINVVL